MKLPRIPMPTNHVITQLEGLRNRSWHCNLRPVDKVDMLDMLDMNIIVFGLSPARHTPSSFRNI